MYQTVSTAADALEAQALSSPRFPPGQLVATPAALTAMEEHRCTPLSLLARHLTGDWGCVPAEDAQANDLALSSGGRVLSSYLIGSETRIWLITESDRSATTFLLPSEY